MNGAINDNNDHSNTRNQNQYDSRVPTSMCNIPHFSRKSRLRMLGMTMSICRASRRYRLPMGSCRGSNPIGFKHSDFVIFTSDAFHPPQSFCMRSTAALAPKKWVAVSSTGPYLSDNRVRNRSGIPDPVVPIREAMALCKLFVSDRHTAGHHANNSQDGRANKPQARISKQRQTVLRKGQDVRCFHPLWVTATRVAP